MNSEYDKTVKLNSLIVATVVSAPALSGTLANGLGVMSGANLYTLIAIVFLYIVKIIKQATGEIKTKWNFTYKTAIILLLVFSLYLFTHIATDGNHRYSIVQLIFYSIIPIFVTTMEFRTEYVLRYAVYISLLTIIGLEGFLAVRWVGVGQADMGKIYSLVTALVCTFFHIRYYGNKANLFLKICYVYNAYLLLRVVMMANRGALLTILFTMFVSFIYKFDSKGIMKIQTTKKILIVCVVVASSIVIIQNFGTIIDWIIELCKSLFNNVPAALVKMRFYIRQEDILNGREEINQIVLSAIKESPIYGHGLDMFYSYTDKEHIYPHNFILQFLFEGGILFALLPVFYSVGALVMVICGQVKNKEQFVFVAMLVCQCFPKLLFSSNVWSGTAIWMLITYSANNVFAKDIKSMKNFLRAKKQYGDSGKYR